MKKVFFIFLIGITSACAQSYAPSDAADIQSTSDEPANIIKGQLLLQFDSGVGVSTARNRASQCGSVIRVITVKPALILVQLPTSRNTNSNAQTCQNLNGLDKVEWNQKRHLR